jgi:hypothetical protein
MCRQYLLVSHVVRGHLNLWAEPTQCGGSNEYKCHISDPENGTGLAIFSECNGSSRIECGLPIVHKHASEFMHPWR